MNLKTIPSLVMASFLCFASLSAVASTAMALSPQDEGGVMTQDLASKGKIVRLPNGYLVTAYAYGNSDSKVVYDIKSQTERPAQDIFIRVSKDEGTTWSAPLNISDTARKTSKQTFWSVSPNGDISQTEYFCRQWPRRGNLG